MKSNQVSNIKPTKSLLEYAIEDLAAIPIPSYRIVDVPLIKRSKCDMESADIMDEKYELRHRTMENAEKREKKRGLELQRYTEYMAKLQKKCPELWPTKKSF